ncbi:hypothetical protein FBZ87_103443 [Nitrospirillum amazonense]|uniref:Lipoprotein n=1 Tax=Nitrospirillum amazonense TaxID=28077 RepID=A0A560K2Q4_9PROT|nr:hypothetical protein [Nitrospirillum amazonense]TWB77625.1 hypothetical protein FBZ87_103443 [Nitrospirillum amazonense]
MRDGKKLGVALALGAGLALGGCSSEEPMGPGPDQKMLQAACALELHTTRPTGTDVLTMYRIELPLTPVDVRRVESTVLADGRDTYYVRAKFNGQVCIGGDVTLVSLAGGKVHVHYEIADLAHLDMMGKPIFVRLTLDDTFDYTPGQIVNRTAGGNHYGFLLK